MFYVYFLLSHRRPRECLPGLGHSLDTGGRGGLGQSRGCRHSGLRSCRGCRQCGLRSCHSNMAGRAGPRNWRRPREKAEMSVFQKLEQD